MELFSPLRVLELSCCESYFNGNRLITVLLSVVISIGSWEFFGFCNAWILLLPSILWSMRIHTGVHLQLRSQWKPTGCSCLGLVLGESMWWSHSLPANPPPSEKRPLDRAQMAITMETHTFIHQKWAFASHILSLVIMIRKKYRLDLFSSTAHFSVAYFHIVENMNIMLWWSLYMKRSSC